MDSTQELIAEHLRSLPKTPGVYFMRDAAGRVIYIGKASNLRSRVGSYFKGQERHDPKTQILVPKIRHIDYIACASEREALILEQRLIRRDKPQFNIMWRDDKSFPFVALTKEDFPRLYMTRERKRKNVAYYGPYPNASDVKQLLRWAWKAKVFPLRPCRYEFDVKHPIAYSKVRSCLYLHTGECPAPCVGKISPARYQRIARKAALFFSGKRETLVKELERDMARASRQMRYEEAARIRDRINGISRMDELVTFKEMTPEEVTGRLQHSRGLTELMKALGLPRPPMRIETFDISHIQGVETVASMVSFSRGLPDKSNYRKFIIRGVPGIDDYSSMREAVGRRYKKIALERGPWPDLILIDGGKGQLSAALEALDSITSKPPPVAALAKENEEIYLPGKSEPVRLPKDSPALHIIQRARDEAHRFAITFHRARRRKRMVK